MLDEKVAHEVDGYLEKLYNGENLTEVECKDLTTKGKEVLSNEKKCPTCPMSCHNLW